MVKEKLKQIKSKVKNNCKTESCSLKAFLYFDKLIVPNLLTVLYWLSLVLVFFLGLVTMFSDGFGSFLYGLIWTIAALIGSRIVFELVLVLFKIHGNLKRLVDAKLGAEEDLTTVDEPQVEEVVPASEVAADTTDSNDDEMFNAR